jgi:iron complex transport system permease protein
MIKKSIPFILVCSLLLVPLSAFIHLSTGEITVSLSDFISAFFDFNADNSTHILIREFKFPRIVMAILAGGGLALSGMLLQTLFNNPLAGPYVLGINSGASLIVALTLMSGFEFFGTDIGLIGSALIGAFLAGIIMMAVAHRIRSQISLLLVGLMFGSFTSALVSILESISGAGALKAFTLWSMGSLQQVEFSQLPLIGFVFICGVILSFFLIKPLNMLVIGERSAGLLGLKISQVRFLIMGITSLLAGLITAYCGPIAFVGLAVPNLTRILLRTQNHRWLILGNLFFGAIFLLLCDSIIQLFSKQIALPINAFTSIIGAPFVVFILMRKLK